MSSKPSIDPQAQTVSSPDEAAANQAPEGDDAPITVWDLVCALQDAADESTDDPAIADRLVELALLNAREWIARPPVKQDKAA